MGNLMIIYLDQNKWIDIAKTISNPERYPKYIDVVKLIKEKADLGEWIFPVSLIHFMETLSRADLKSRKNLASVISSISKNYSIKSFVEIEKEEFVNLFAKLHDATKQMSISAIKKNIFPAIGADKVDVTFKHELPSEVKELIQDVVESLVDDENIFTMFMEQGYSQDLIKENNEGDQLSKKQWEKTQKYLQTLPKEHKYKICLVEGFLVQFKSHEKLLSTIFKKNREELIPPSIFKESESTINFLESIPSLNVQINLMYELLKNPQRPIQLHDNRDVAFLATAIPYCDIVITERTWKHAAKARNLNIKYSTIIENDLTFLMSI